MACRRSPLPIGPFAVALALSGCGGCAALVGPEGEIAQYLAAQSEAPPRFPIPGGAELELSQVRFDHLLVKAEGEGLVAVGQVDAEGTYGAQAKVSYIGFERVPFVRRDGRYLPKGALLPALQEVGALLLARHAAEDARDPAALETLVATAWADPQLTREAALARMRERIGAAEGKAEVRRWIVRVDREGAEVLEETASGSTRLVLTREAGRFRIASGNL